jgi:hypothetical protein
MGEVQLVDEGRAETVDLHKNLGKLSQAMSAGRLTDGFTWSLALEWTADWNKDSQTDQKSAFCRPEKKS